MKTIQTINGRPDSRKKERLDVSCKSACKVDLSTIDLIDIENWMQNSRETEFFTLPSDPVKNRSCIL
jgi:hypothetical protein